MRAIIEEEHGGPEVLVVSDQPTPTPGPGQVLLRVAASGVNRADVSQRQGFYPPPPGASSVYGLEVSGTVEAVGEGVDEGYLNLERAALLAGGGYAEYAAVDLNHTLPVPEGTSLEDAAGLIEVAATVYSNLVLTLGVAPRPEGNDGKTLLIHGGTGGIGTHAIELARALGLQVFATGGNDEKCDFIRALGAEAINYRTQDFREAVRQLTDGRGVDYILDVVGGAYLEENIKTLAVGWLYGRHRPAGRAQGATQPGLYAPAPLERARDLPALTVSY